MRMNFPTNIKCKTCPHHSDICDTIRKKEVEGIYKYGKDSITAHLTTDTLCWCCEYALPEEDCPCKWSTVFKPVEGWEAKKRKINGADSYHVISCPLFKRGGSKEWDE